jgi:hypothetical protein
MAYHSHHCSATLHCSACISVSLLASAALSVLLLDMHLCSLLLLCFISCTQHASTRLNHSQQQHLIPSRICVFMLSVHLLHPPCTMPLHTLHCISVLSYRLFTATLPPYYITPHSRIISLLYSASFFLVESSPDHHGNTSSSLAVSFMRSSSLGIMLRFLSFSGTRDSLSSLSVTASRLCLLWLLSPFLRVTTGR